jgi:ribosomal protein S18 acetylase RimI-like enzyme
MIRAFREDDLDAAAELLAERHRRHCAAQPLLSAERDFRAEVETLWQKDGAAGAFADGGYVLGWSRPDSAWGPNIWVEAAGHAANEPELVRDLYEFAASRWVEQGLKAHYVLVPATDEGLVDAWFRLSFGAQHAQGVLEIPDVAWPRGVREAEERDVDAMVELAPFLNRHQRHAPVFSPAASWTVEELRADILEDLAKDEVGNLVTELDGHVVGNFVVCPIELSKEHDGLARLPGAAFLSFAITHPDARGSGAGVALTDACFAWARERGYRTMLTDWRVTNLLSSRFWQKRGFPTSFLRLHRLIA